jgi:glycosyltransferase involved in cell wall biosynthesis
MLISEMDCSISLCICTMNRPNDLERCLGSVFKGVEQPNEIIVSDDSLDGQLSQAVVAKYSSVIYQEGPHRGLGANRNACVRSATGSHLIFIDDDVQISPEFFQTARRLIMASPKTVISGYEMNYAGGQIRKITPHNTDFWGLQRVPVTKEYRSLVINATIFPKTLFDQALFDEQLRYGSDEIDIACHAVALGYTIAYNDQLYVHHYPSPVNRDHYQQFVHASRLYATTKAYWQYERSIFKTTAYLLFAPLQLIGSTIKQRELPKIWQAFTAIVLAWRYLLAAHLIRP